LHEIRKDFDGFKADSELLIGDNTTSVITIDRNTTQEVEALKAKQRSMNQSISDLEDTTRAIKCKLERIEKGLCKVFEKLDIEHFVGDEEFDEIE
jgi:hypothetical protein